MKKQIDTFSINTGDTLLVSSHGFLQEAIQTFENCKWNHAGMFLWLNNLLYVCEATEKGIVITLFSRFEDRAGIGLLVLKPKPTQIEVDEHNYINFCLPYVGHTNYGFFNLLVAQAVRFMTKKKIWIGPKRDPKTHHFICGEFVAFVYNHFNPEVFNDWNELAPSDLFDAKCFDSYVYK
jgi:hypothetical protein